MGYHYLVEALLEGDRSDVLLDMLERTDTPSYGYQLAQGATSLTEAWDANRDSSQDHFMLGDIEEWFYRGLGGINVDFAGEGSQPLILRPAVVGNLKWVRTSYQSALGTIESSWERGPQRMEYNFTIPPNTAALIDLSSPPDEAVTVNGAAPAKATGVISVKPSGKRLQIEVGSGRYLIRASSPPQTSSLH